MGFSRSWKLPYGITPTAWQAILGDVRRVLQAVNIPLRGAAEEDQEAGEATLVRALFSNDKIAFNGVDPQAGEWFVLRPAPSDFECVKTYARPYDCVVAAVLAIAKHHAPTEILNVTSDDFEGGDNWEIWKASFELCAAAGVRLSKQSIQLLKADIEHVSAEYEPPKSPEQRELDAEWKRMYEGNLLKAFCEERFPPTYLRYQTSSRLNEGAEGLRLKMRRSIDTRALPTTSPILREKMEALKKAWNESHKVKIVEIELS